MLIKQYEKVMKVTPQERMAKQYAERQNKTENTIKPVEGKKCQPKKAMKVKVKK